jgi:hypothetical protein
VACESDARVRFKTLGIGYSETIHAAHALPLRWGRAEFLELRACVARLYEAGSMTAFVSSGG